MSALHVCPFSLPSAISIEEQLHQSVFALAVYHFLFLTAILPLNAEFLFYPPFSSGKLIIAGWHNIHHYQFPSAGMSPQTKY